MILKIFFLFILILQLSQCLNTKMTTAKQECQSIWGTYYLGIERSKLSETEKENRKNISIIGFLLCK